MNNLNILYCIKHPLTQEVRYIGIAKNFKKRVYEHCKLRAQYPVGRWLIKLHAQNLKPIFEIVESYQTQEELKEAEIWAIKYARICGFRLLNITNGGEGTVGYKHTDATKEKLRLRALARPSKTKGRSNALKGVKLTGARYESFLKGMKNRKWSEKMQTTFAKNKHLGPEKLQKAIECSNGKTYNSIREAADELDLHRPNIICCLKGRYKQTGGYTFRYVGSLDKKD